MPHYVKRHLIRSLMLLLGAVGLLVLLTVGGAAQEGSPVLSISQVLSEEFPEVLAYVTVLDSSGLALPGLNEGAFLVFEDGNPVTQFAVTPASAEGIQIILAVDTSGSMRGGTALADAKSAVSTFLSQLGSQDQAALLVFAESADLVQDFTSDMGALQSAVDGLAALPNARTALYEAAFEAATRMGQLQPGRKAIVVFTDGHDTVGGFSLKDAIDQAHDANVPIYTIGLLGGEFDPAPMRQLAEATGGTYVEAPSSDELTSTFETVRELLERQYALRYASSLQPENRQHELRVQVSIDGATAEDRQSFLPLPLTPWVSITAPSDGEAVAASVPVAVEVVAREPIAEVSLTLDGGLLASLATPPYRHQWDASTAALGSRTLAAEAKDVQGRTGAAQISVDVQPVLTLAIQSPKTGADVVGVVEVQTDIQAYRKLREVVVSVDGTALDTVPAAPYTYRWDTAELAPGPHQLSVRGEDELGATASDQIDVNVQPVVTATWISPQSSDEITATVTLMAAAQAHYGIERLEFYADGQLLGATTSPPHEIAWSTLNLEERDYDLQACAFDVLGHRDCAGVTLELSKPGPGTAMFIALGFILVVIVLVTVMVVRTRQRQVAARRPAAAAPVTPYVPEHRTAPPAVSIRPEAATVVGQRAVAPGGLTGAEFVIQGEAGQATRSVSLGPGETLIGRAADCDIYVDDELVSRRHALVTYEPHSADYIFSDLNPTNPSIINGQEYREPHTLRADDTILIGDTTLLFRRD